MVKIELLQNGKILEAKKVSVVFFYVGRKPKKKYYEDELYVVKLKDIKDEVVVGENITTFMISKSKQMQIVPTHNIVQVICESLSRNNHINTLAT